VDNNTHFGLLANTRKAASIYIEETNVTYIIGSEISTVCVILERNEHEDTHITSSCLATLL
jgi:hypothetical protein